MNKKIIATLSATLLLAGGVVAGLVGAQAPISLWMKDHHEIQLEAEPYIVDGRTMVPLYAFCEELGWNPWWIEDDQDAGAYNGRYEIIFHVGEKEVEIFDYETEQRTRKPIDVPAAIVNDRIMVPVRALCENADVEVEWDGEQRKVIIMSEPDEKDISDEKYSDGSVLEGLNVNDDTYDGFEDFDFSDSQYDDISKEEKG